MKRSRRNSGLSGNTPKRYFAGVKHKKNSGTGILVVGTFFCIFGLLAAFHAAGMTTHAHAKLSGIVAKFSGGAEEVEKVEVKAKTKIDSRKCLTASTYDPKFCKKYGSSQVRQKF